MTQYYTHLRFFVIDHFGFQSFSFFSFKVSTFNHSINLTEIQVESLRVVLVLVLELVQVLGLVLGHLKIERTQKFTFFVRTSDRFILNFTLQRSHTREWWAWVWVAVWRQMWNICAHGCDNCQSKHEEFLQKITKSTIIHYVQQNEVSTDWNFKTLLTILKIFLKVL